MSEREENAIAILEADEDVSDGDRVIGDLKYMTETEIIDEKKTKARKRAATERNIVPF